MVRENSEDFKGIYGSNRGSSPQCPLTKKEEYGKNIKRKKILYHRVIQAYRGWQ